jgi:DNA-binding XRE family transcriptional regulator
VKTWERALLRREEEQAGVEWRVRPNTLAPRNAHAFFRGTPLCGHAARSASKFKPAPESIRNQLCVYCCAAISRRLGKISTQPIRSAFGATVRRLREERGFTQKRFAEVARIAQSTMSSIEAGRAFVGPRRAARIAAALGVDVGVLMVPQRKSGESGAAGDHARSDAEDDQPPKP